MVYNKSYQRILGLFLYKNCCCECTLEFCKQCDIMSTHNITFHETVKNKTKKNYHHIQTLSVPLWTQNNTLPMPYQTSLTCQHLVRNGLRKLGNHHWNFFHSPQASYQVIIELSVTLLKYNKNLTKNYWITLGEYNCRCPVRTVIIYTLSHAGAMET